MRRSFLVVIATLLFQVSMSQDRYPHAVAYYDFIQYDSNRIEHFGDKNALAPFHDKLDSVTTYGAGRVNILHFGGSHIQADVWSGQLRKHFQFLTGGLKGPRGLVFPFDIAKTNNPSSYHTSYTGVWSRERCASRRDKADWGLTGMMVATTDTNASFTMYAKSRYYYDYDFSKIRIFYRMDSMAFGLSLPAEDSMATFRYDSAAGYVEIDFGRLKDTFTVYLDKTDSLQRAFQLYGVQFDSEESGVVYHAMGVNGADVPAYLRCNLMAQQLEAVQPDLIIFSVGINDAYTTRFKPEEYKAHYDSLIRMIRGVYPEVAILFTTNNDSYYKRRYPNKNVYDVSRVMRELSREHNCAVWDMFEVMGGLGSIDKWVQLDMAKGDKIHFRGNGYRLIGDLMFSALMTDYQQYLTIP